MKINVDFVGGVVVSRTSLIPRNFNENKSHIQSFCSIPLIVMISKLMHCSWSDACEEFLFACRHGDSMTIERLFRDGSIRREDICKPVGAEQRSGIAVAIKQNHQLVVQFLLDQMSYEDLRESLLLSIYLDSTDVGLMIINHPTFNRFNESSTDETETSSNTLNESHFDGVQPIQLAAQHSRLVILYELLKRGKTPTETVRFVFISFSLEFFGERIEVPHSVQCQCELCRSTSQSDSFRYSQIRLETYRALSSPFYLSLVYRDPIEIAFQLSKELSTLAKNEPYFRREYLTLIKQVSMFSADLLDHIQNETELENLITEERFHSAFLYEQLEFVVHSKTQQRLRLLTYGYMSLKEDKILSIRPSTYIRYLVQFLPMYIAYFWLPFWFQRRCKSYFSKPHIRTALQASTFQIFLVLTILNSFFKPKKISLKHHYPIVFNYYKSLISNDSSNIYIPETYFGPIKYLWMIWLFGYILRNFKRIVLQRYRSSIYACLLEFTLIATFLCVISAGIEFSLNWRFILDIERWRNLEKAYNSSVHSTETYECMKNEFLLRFARLQRSPPLPTVDMIMLADALMSLMIILIILQLSLFLIISVRVGLLLTLFVNTSRTIYRLFLLFFIAFLAFDTAFRYLLAHYHGSLLKEESNGILYFNQSMNISVSRMKVSSLNIFFTLFGAMDNELTRTNKRKYQPLQFSPNQTNYYYHLSPFVSIFGSMLYGCFAFFSRILLVALFIAYIKRTYRLLQKDGLKNWKYARSKIFLHFISKFDEIKPVPFNIIPTPMDLKNWIRKAPIKKLHVRAQLSDATYLRDLYESHTARSLNSQLSVMEVLDRIVQRFLRKHLQKSFDTLKRNSQKQCRHELCLIRQYFIGHLRRLQQTQRLAREQIGKAFSMNE